MPTIEQGGNSLYPSMAQRATSVEVLRILISIGPTETMHFQTWSDKAGNAPPLTDPTNGLVFPNLNAAPFGGEEFQTNLIMPEPCPFLSRKLPAGLDYTSHGDAGDCHGRGELFNLHGTFHRSIEAVFCASARLGRRCRLCSS